MSALESLLLFLDNEKVLGANSSRLPAIVNDFAKNRKLKMEVAATVDRCNGAICKGYLFSGRRWASKFSRKRRTIQD